MSNNSMDETYGVAATTTAPTGFPIHNNSSHLYHHHQHRSGRGRCAQAMEVGHNIWRAFLAPARRQLTCILLPLVLLPIPLACSSGGEKEAWCAYVVLIMGYFWVCEVLPLAVTSLIPVFAFPILGIETAHRISGVYLSDPNFVFFGSMVMAVAVEASNLHERIALSILLFTGPNPRWLMLGFQLATAFLSMWISNTATTAMMVPIVVAVIRELDICQRRQSDADAMRPPESTAKVLPDMEHIPKRQLKIYKGLLLSICFSASIGGTGTLIGTGSNIVLNGYLQKVYRSNSPVTFASWMLFALPQVAILIVVCWLWLQTLFIGFRAADRSHESLVRRMLRKKYDALGRLSYEEKSILACFALLIALWLTRQPQVVPGWGKLFSQGYVTDGTASMLVAFLLFVLPAENPFTPAPIVPNVAAMGDASSTLSAHQYNPAWAKKISEGGTKIEGITIVDSQHSATSHVPPNASGFNARRGQSTVEYRTIMTWPAMRDKFSWSTLLLLGGGYAMAMGVESSGLSDTIGQRLASLDFLPEYLFIAISCCMVVALTEFSSNVATSSIFIPMVASIARIHNISPLPYILPVALSSSYAFMFPSGTPPNAIVFSAKILRVRDMVSRHLFDFFQNLYAYHRIIIIWFRKNFVLCFLAIGGSMLNLCALVLTQLAVHTYGQFIFDMSSTNGVTFTLRQSNNNFSSSAINATSTNIKPMQGLL